MNPEPCRADMKLDTLHIPDVGDVSSGGTIEVPEEVGAALTKQDPRVWGG